MGRLPNESYLDYRKRMIDSVSPSFCAAKWYNATIWLGAGITASCHHPPGRQVSVEEVVKNHKAIHNTKHKKEMRQLMLDGKRPSECDYCWKIEDIQRENISDRVYKTVIYSDEDVRELANQPWDGDVNLKTLEIAFDRTCNFACSYCNPGFSSTWVKDIRENGPYENLKSDGKDHYTSTNDWGQLYDPSDDNPYVDAFWKWWPELSQSLQELRVTGGEPTLSPQFWKLLDWFSTNEGSRIRFAMNSNLGGKPEIMDRLIAKSQSIKDFVLYTSCENIGASAEYVRDGLVYENWKKNLVKLIEANSMKSIVIMMTISNLSVWGLTDFMDEMIELKEKYGRDFPSLSLNLLRFPSFQSVAILPEDLKLQAKQKIADWFEGHKSSSLLHEMEKSSIQRVIDYLDAVKTPHQNTSNSAILWKDLRGYLTQYDQRRKKQLSQALHPTFARWVGQIEA